MNLKRFNKNGVNHEIERLNNLNIQTEYLSYVNLPHFDVPENPSSNQAIVYAGYLGQIRLIDNLLL
jgi:pantothenate synthetase